MVPPLQLWQTAAGARQARVASPAHTWSQPAYCEAFSKEKRPVLMTRLSGTCAAGMGGHQPPSLS